MQDPDRIEFGGTPEAPVELDLQGSCNPDEKTGQNTTCMDIDRCSQEGTYYKHLIYFDLKSQMPRSVRNAKGNVFQLKIDYIVSTKDQTKDQRLSTLS